jgi:hypothetical protein
VGSDDGAVVGGAAWVAGGLAGTAAAAGWGDTVTDLLRDIVAGSLSAVEPSAGDHPDSEDEASTERLWQLTVAVTRLAAAPDAPTGVVLAAAGLQDVSTRLLGDDRVRPRSDRLAELEAIAAGSPARMLVVPDGPHVPPAAQRRGVQERAVPRDRRGRAGCRGRHRGASQRRQLRRALRAVPVRPVPEQAVLLGHALVHQLPRPGSRHRYHPDHLRMGRRDAGSAADDPHLLREVRPRRRSARSAVRLDVG